MVLPHFLFFVFCALRAQKTKNSWR